LAAATKQHGLESWQAVAKSYDNASAILAAVGSGLGPGSDLCGDHIFSFSVGQLIKQYNVGQIH